MWLGTLWEDTGESALCLSLTLALCSPSVVWEYSEKACVHEAEELSSERDHAGTSTTDIPSPELWELDYCLDEAGCGTLPQQLKQRQLLRRSKSIPRSLFQVSMILYIENSKKD